MRKQLLVSLTVLSMLAAACQTAGSPDTPAVDAAVDATTAETTATGTDDLLAVVQARGELNCGVNESLPGFGFKDESGAFSGFDVDLCRAVAAALFGDANKVKYEAVTAAARFEAVNGGLIDLLSRNTTWTQSRDTELGLDFGPTTYYDGQQLMAKTADGFSAASDIPDLEGATVCTNAGTTTEKNIAEVAAAAGVNITVQTFDDFGIVLENFKSGVCNVITTDGSSLVANKVTDPEGEGWVIFPERPISKEPLGPGWAQNNSRFGDVVTWTVFAMIIAEEKGITSANVDAQVANPADDEVARLLGVGDDELQTKMGLPADAFYQVIKQVGSYGEIFDRNLAPLGLARGLNALWTDGGLQFAPPAR